MLLLLVQHSENEIISLAGSLRKVCSAIKLYQNCFKMFRQQQEFVRPKSLNMLSVKTNFQQSARRGYLISTSNSPRTPLS